jgi:hypothetical protein
VIAFEADGVILSESGGPPKPEAPKAAPGMGGRPGGGIRPGAAPKQGPAEPLAVIAGNVATAVPVPILYRWSLGKSLQDLTRLTPTQAKDVLRRVAAGETIFVAAVPN